MSVHVRATVAAAGASLLLLLAAWRWAPPPFQPDAALNTSSTQATPLSARADAVSPGGEPWRRTTTVRDVPDPLLVPGLRDTLEDLLLAAGDYPDPASLKRRLAELVGQYFDPALATRGLAMAERYVDFRVALGELRLPEDISQPDSLRASVDARDALRRQFFAPEEYAALFADQEALDRYTLVRLQIEQDASLSATARAAALQSAEAGLGDQQRAERAYSQVQVATAAQTARFDTEGTDERSRWTARSAQFGEGAATRLAALDAQESDWNRRLDLYAQARQGQQGQQGKDAIAHLRTQLFSTEEALRLEGALALREASQAKTSGSTAQR